MRLKYGLTVSHRHTLDQELEQSHPNMRLYFIFSYSYAQLAFSLMQYPSVALISCIVASVQYILDRHTALLQHAQEKQPHCAHLSN